MNGKIIFLKKEFIPLLQRLTGNEIGKWGKMNSWQMIEHVSGFFKVSTGQIIFPLTTPPEHLAKYREFLMSEKPFRENTRAPVLPEEPLPVRFSSITAAREKLAESVDEFFAYFRNDPAKTTLHPAFGELNFEEWVQLHHKHVMHHLRQFEVIG